MYTGKTDSFIDFIVIKILDERLGVRLFNFNFQLFFNANYIDCF